MTLIINYYLSIIYDLSIINVCFLVSILMFLLPCMSRVVYRFFFLFGGGGGMRGKRGWVG